MKDIVLLIAGGAIGWATNWFFYWKGSAGAAEAARRVMKNQHGINVLGRMMEAEKRPECVHDEGGNLIGFKLFAEAHATSVSTLTGSASLLPPPPPPTYDRQHEQPDP